LLNCSKTEQIPVYMVRTPDLITCFANGNNYLFSEKLVIENMLRDI